MASCKAEKVSTGEVTTISSSSVDGVCNSASQMLSWLDSQSNTGSSSGSGLGSGTGSQTQTNYGACTKTVIEAYNNVNTSALLVSSESSIEKLIVADISCEQFKAAIGSYTCQAQKIATGSSFWISYSDYSTICGQVKNYKANASALAEIEKKKISEFKGTVSFVLLKGEVQAVPNDIIVYQNGKAFVANEKNLIDEAKPYCLASAKFSSFVSGNQTVSFKHVFTPNTEDLVALAVSKEKPNEENSINCVNAKGKPSKDLTVRDLRSIFKGIATVLVGK